MALTEKQQKFLDVLFEEARGNPVEAKKLAGYSENVATSSITNALKEQIADLTKKFISSSATKAKLILCLKLCTVLQTWVTKKRWWYQKIY